MPKKNKRVYRVYVGFQSKSGEEVKNVTGKSQALYQPEQINQVWSIDFMNDTPWLGGKFKLSNIIDNYNRQVSY